MVISDAKTAEDFRAEVLAEIDRRCNGLAYDAKNARTKRDSRDADERVRELRFLRAFLTEIRFGEFPKGGHLAFPKRPGAAAFAAGYTVERRYEGWRVIGPDGQIVRDEAHDGERAAWMRADALAQEASQ